MDRFNPQYILAICYATAAIFIAAIGSVAASPLLVGIAVFFAGFCISGSQVGANALSASFYPMTDCRATGVSWANGVGRSGSILGSMSGGVLLTMDLHLSTHLSTVFSNCRSAGLDRRRINVCFWKISRGKKSGAWWQLNAVH
jgi:AAHS family 4-hydroxybenzoate transporter-like MFS transporter